MKKGGRERERKGEKDCRKYIVGEEGKRGGEGRVGREGRERGEGRGGEGRGGGRGEEGKYIHVLYLFSAIILAVGWQLAMPQCFFRSAWNDLRAF